MSRNKDKHHVPEGDKATPENTVPGKAAAAAPGAAPEQATPATAVEAKLQSAELEIVQLKDQMLRLRADFDNFRKRALREKVEVYDNANEALMLELLPVLDHFQLALDSAREHQADRVLLEGLQLIFDQLLNILSKYGLAPFNSEKQIFDHGLHEAISALPSATEPEGVIITQGRQGYRFKNKLLRPAQVVVSSGKPQPPAAAKDSPPLKE